MSSYQKIEYRIGTDGQIHETVLNGEGSSCTLATAGIEAELGTVLQRELLPEYQNQAEAEEATHLPNQI
ncbi:MAG: DUF2997 domain-containing protein [Synechococcaceae cyanobacterium RM1_1_27]|nr:DUF2997 domain-containing protein [Synechococcaceae cyanobacterium SM2_3_2]NJO85627.1 DUF2997 domain-containing protein [Synechococcaceae cyanobacterium RM1_1_27]